MKKLMILTALFCGTISVFAQGYYSEPLAVKHPSKENNFEEKVLKIYEKDTQYFTVETFFSCGKMYRFHLKDSLLHTGIIEIYRDEALTEIREKISFKNYLKDGKEVRYGYMNSEVHTELVYEQGMKIYEKSYNPKLYRFRSFKNGKEHTCKEYHKNGQLKKDWVNWGDFGECAFYYDNGQLHYKEAWENGKKRAGLMEKYEKNGMRYEANYYNENGRLDSLLYYQRFDENELPRSPIISSKYYFDKNGSRTFYYLYDELGRLKEKYNYEKEETTRYEYHIDGSYTVFITVKGINGVEEKTFDKTGRIKK